MAAHEIKILVQWLSASDTSSECEAQRSEAAWSANDALMLKTHHDCFVVVACCVVVLSSEHKSPSKTGSGETPQFYFCAAAAHSTRARCGIAA
jgi:hypothetical protein